MSKKWFFLMVLIVGVSFVGSVYQHEMVHVFANQKAGITSHIDFVNYLPAIATVRDSNATNDLSNLELAHSFNESINYNVTPLLMGVMALIILATFYLGQKIQEMKQ